MSVPDGRRVSVLVNATPIRSKRTRRGDAGGHHAGPCSHGGVDAAVAGAHDGTFDRDDLTRLFDGTCA
ncbi:MAG: hypothetical protein F4X40_05480 [Chloroflexi bacterium]|nr:hypothetical protein [Chloroflexota bacterium]